MDIFCELHEEENVFIEVGGWTVPHPPLPHMPVFTADETTKLLAFVHPDERPPIESMNLAPPFKRFFVQTRLPMGYDEFNAECSSILPINGRLAPVEVRTTMNDVAMDVTVSEDKDDLANFDSIFTPNTSFRWRLTCHLYFGSDGLHNAMGVGDPLCQSNYSFHVLLDENGALVPFTPTNPNDARLLQSFLGQDGTRYTLHCSHAGCRTVEEFANLAEESKRKFVRTFEEYYPLFYAINALHSKRTEVVDRLPSRQQKRNATRHGKQEPPTYKEIKVKNFIKIYRDAVAARNVGRQYPLHDVIGQWKTYGIDGRKKLFGKHTGRFWFEPHLRGNPEIGATDHDYRMTG